MWPDAAVRSASDPGDGVLGAGAAGRVRRRLRARAAAVSEHRRPVDPSAVVVSRCVDDRDARRDRAPARGPTRRRARSRSPRDLDPTRAGVGRCRLRAQLRSEQRPRAGARPRPERAAPVAQRPHDARDLALQSERSRRRLARPAFALAGPGDLSSLAINKIVPALEQVQGVSFVQANGTVNPSIQVSVSPKQLSSSGFTLTDLVTTITNNNVRAPGGILYSPNRETNIDVRGDIQNVPTVAGLLLGASGGANLSARTTPGRLRGGCSTSATSPTSPTPMSRSASMHTRTASRASRSTSRSRPARARSRPRNACSPRSPTCSAPIPTSASPS